MGPFYLTSQRLKKEKKRVLFSKGFYWYDLTSPSQQLGVLGEGRCVTVPILWMEECPERLKALLGGWLHIYSGSRKEETHVLLPRLVSSYGSMYPVPGSTHLPSTSNLPTSQKVKVGGINKKPSSPLGLNTHLTLREITAIFSYLGRIPPAFPLEERNVILLEITFPGNWFLKLLPEEVFQSMQTN